MNNREGNRAFIMSCGCKVDIEGGGGSQPMHYIIHVKCSTLIETPDIYVWFKLLILTGKKPNWKPNLLLYVYLVPTYMMNASPFLTVLQPPCIIMNKQTVKKGEAWEWGLHSITQPPSAVPMSHTECSMCNKHMSTELLHDWRWNIIIVPAMTKCFKYKK